MEKKLLKGNNLELLKTLEPNSVDSVVTDAPYGLSFMNKKWDYDVPSVEFWTEVYRVLKPGGHILCFGGTRTYHRMVVNIEDAGFEIRDCIQWIYGSGFPKSLNVGKAVDKLEGNEREYLGEKTGGAYSDGTNNLGINRASSTGEGDGRKTPQTRGEDFGKITKGNSEYEGWGTGLKPANEPIVLARKPIEENTIVKNVLEYGTGGINIDGCRIGSDIIPSPQHNTKDFVAVRTAGEYNNTYDGNIINNEGRFPANVILECTCDEVIRGEKGEKKDCSGLNKMSWRSWKNSSKIINRINFTDKADIHTNPECPCYIMDEQSGESKSIKSNMKLPKTNSFTGLSKGVTDYDKKTERGFDDKGGASRFFYQAKVSKKERNMGIDKNNHPTVKPINLLTYLVRMVTPPNGVVLDAYMGSGSTGIAALLEGFKFIGMEMDDEYFNIAEARINNYEEYRKLLK